MRHAAGLLALSIYAAAVTAALLPDRHDPDRHGPRNPEPDPNNPACPLCGGGPIVQLAGGAWACKSCARVVNRRATP